MTTKKFTRTKENFVCEHCNAKVVGNGYTNHCPACLWAKHVDVNPGDRANICQGMMQPIGLESKNGNYRIIHKCKKCGMEKKNKTAKNDNNEIITTL